MDPITLTMAAISIAGLGLEMFGGSKAAKKEKEAAGISRQMAGLELEGEAIRHKSMELSSRRQQAEIFRTSQRARAIALAAATSQGAQFGSGLSGGYGQIAGQTGVNLTGVWQNQMLAEDMFGVNSRISAARMQMAGVKSEQASAMGMMSLGGSLMKAGPTLGAMSGSVFGRTPVTNRYPGDVALGLTGGGYGGGGIGSR